MEWREERDVLFQATLRRTKQKKQKKFVAFAKNA